MTPVRNVPAQRTAAHIQTCCAVQVKVHYHGALEDGKKFDASCALPHCHVPACVL